MEALGSDGGGFHQGLLSKQLLEVKDVFLTVLSCPTHTHTHTVSPSSGLPLHPPLRPGGLTGGEAGAAPQPLVPLLEAPEDGVEEHLVPGLLRRVQELPGRHVVMATCSQSSAQLEPWQVEPRPHPRTHAADEPERRQDLVLGQQDLHDLIVGCGETLHTHTHGA